MENQCTIFADFNNADYKGRIRLNTSGTLEDLQRKNLKLEAGLKVILDDADELTALATVEYSDDERIWVARLSQ